MTSPKVDGWRESAQAWIDSLGQEGDFGRRFVLDAPMRARASRAAPGRALDVGCGEGRFCRMLQGLGFETLGVDPTERLVARARELDPEGEYQIASAEEMAVPPESFDLVASYLSLIDIPDLDAAAANMANALKPGGSLLIANLTSFSSAGNIAGRWLRDRDGNLKGYLLDHYLEERAEWVEWKGIRILNWHRPLESYMRAFLDLGLILSHFAEPAPQGGDPETVARYKRAPWFHMMEWRKPL